MTMKDVAKIVGCSVNTVSRALNNKAEISPETKARVLEVVAKLGYKPNRFARALRSSKTGTIGVIVTDIANPFFGALVKGIEEAARKFDYSIILQNTDEDYEKEKQAIQVMFAQYVDGLLITPVQKGRKTIEELKESGLPFVLLGRYFANLDTDYVVTDDVEGGFRATEYLIKLGHSRIAMINGPVHISSAKDRFQGYKKALMQYGIELDPSLIYDGAVRMEDGYRIARMVLDLQPRPTAIFAYSDLVAFGVMRAVAEAGLCIPDDMAIVGYDDIQFSAHAQVPLTTVRIPKRELGERAVEKLLQRLEHGKPAEKCGEKLPVELVIRASTGKEVVKEKERNRTFVQGVRQKEEIKGGGIDA